MTSGTPTGHSSPLFRLDGDGPPGGAGVGSLSLSLSGAFVHVPIATFSPGISKWRPVPTR